MKIKPLTLIIEKETWDSFKNIVPSSISLNDAVVELIKRELEDGKEK